MVTIYNTDGVGYQGVPVISTPFANGALHTLMEDGMNEDLRPHLRKRLDRDKAQQAARDADVELHRIAMRFVQHEATRLQLWIVLDAANKAESELLRLDQEYKTSWRQVVDETISAE